MATWVSWEAFCRPSWVSSSSWAPFPIQVARPRLVTRSWHDINLLRERVKGKYGGWKYFVGIFRVLGALVAIRSLEKQPYPWQAGCRTPRTDKGKSSGIKLACGEQAAAALARRPARAS
jgi:hypothetical protein